MDSIREKIIAAIQSRLSNVIAVECQRVPRLRRDYEGDALLGLIDGEDVPEAIEYGAIRRVMRVDVQYIKRFDPATQNESLIANGLLADIEAAVTGTDTTLGGLCLMIRYAGGSPAYDANTPSVWAAAAAVFDVTYQTDIGDPFTDSNPH